jgi:hypothetical protein
MVNCLIPPPIWNVPYQRNLFFTGRDDVLTQLHASLQMDKTAALTQPQGSVVLVGSVKRKHLLSMPTVIPVSIKLFSGFELIDQPHLSLASSTLPISYTYLRRMSPINNALLKR